MLYRSMALATLMGGLFVGVLGQAVVAEEPVCGPYAETDNAEFSIEFLEYTWDPNTRSLTLYYEVCKLGEGPEVSDLSHVVFGLGQFSACLREDCGPYDFLVGCAQTAPFPMGGTPGPYIMEGADDPNAPVCVLINNDPTTGVTGLKFDNLVLGDGECQRFAFRLDIGCLVDGMHVGEGCIEVATKAGNQDIENPDNLPGYAEVTGPVCIEHHVDQ